MKERARFIGGPEDGQVKGVQLQGGRPVELLRIPVVPRIDPVAYVPAHPDGDPVDTQGRGPAVMEYRLHLDATGHPSRAEDGSLRYAYRGTT
jgi:hypothetical protein